MPPDPPPGSLVVLRDVRERAIAQLSDAFAHDRLELEEFERRLTVVHRAGSIAEVEQALSDLNAAPSPVELVAVRAAPVVHANPPAAHTMAAILGGVERRGIWAPPRRLRAVAILGGIVLDLRDASLPAGVTEIDVTAVMGGVQLLVPPGLSVEVTGSAILGGFDHVERVPAQVAPDQPVLRVHGLAVLGGVSVETRLRGESEEDAHRRRRPSHTLGTSKEPMQLPEGGSSGSTTSAS